MAGFIGIGAGRLRRRRARRSSGPTLTAPDFAIIRGGSPVTSGDEGDETALTAESTGNAALDTADGVANAGATVVTTALVLTRNGVDVGTLTGTDDGSLAIAGAADPLLAADAGVYRVRREVTVDGEPYSRLSAPVTFTVALEPATLVTPAADAQLPDNDNAIAWEATTSYPGSTVRIALLLDGTTEIATDSSDPYTDGGIDGAAISPGAHTITTRRYVTGGAFVDGTPVDVLGVDTSITIDPNTGTEGVQLDIDATGPELVGASSVELFDGGVSVSTDSDGAPWEFSIVDPAPGPHEITVEVDGGITLGPATINFAAVAAVLTEPDGDETISVGATFQFVATTLDDTDGVTFNVTGPGGYDEDFTGVDAGGGTSWTYDWDTMGLAVGEYTVTPIRHTAAPDVAGTPATVDLAEASDLALVHRTVLSTSLWTEPPSYFGPFSGDPGKAWVNGWAAGGGGSTNVGAGGGGERRAGEVSPTGDETVTIGTGAANADGGNTSFGALLVAVGGLSGTNGGTGGTGGSGGSENANGSNGALGTGSRAGGAGGAPGGGFGQADTVGRVPGGGGGSNTSAQRAGASGRCVVAHLEPAPSGYAFPFSWTQGTDAANAGSRNITLPSGTGGRLYCWVACDGGGAALGMIGWSSHARADQSTNVSGQLFYRDSDGSDPVALTSASEQLSWICWRGYGPSGALPGASTQSATPTAATTANADPPSVTDAGGSAPQWALVCAAWDLSADGAPGITGFPTDYTNQIIQQGAGIGGAAACVCWRHVTTDTENPSAFTSVAEQHVVVTVLVRPS